MTARIAPDPGGFAARADTVVIGAGAAGLCAALAAREAGRSVVVLERDGAPAGSTALSAGLIPAAGTRAQRAAGIEDDADRFAADIQRKADGENDPTLVDRLARGSGPAVDWLAGLGLPLTLVEGFDYPGHSRRRMHGLPDRAGRSLVDALRARAEAAGADLICDAAVDTLFRDGDRITGAGLARGDAVGCDRVVLACNGFGGDRTKVRAHMPAIAEATWFGHDGNRGEALDWGEALGAATRYLGAYQGHGNVAHPHGILVTWATITEGGVQVNARGERFHDESRGYSEAARAVLAQPGGWAVTIWDERIEAAAAQFEDYRRAVAAGAVVPGDAVGIAARFDLPADALAATLADRPARSESPDRFGRVFDAPPLRPHLRAARVTGALFHTQGGLVVDEAARVTRLDGSAFPNLLAAGGAACGVSGAGDAGYLSGNGLLSAVVLGRIAGAA